ncbi:MAG TPA: SMP-30/gluconolactonase/LRE family protein, partial [Trebonia sp.]
MDHMARVRKPPIQPVRRKLPPAPPDTPRGPGDFPAARLIPLPGHGPEDVVTDAAGMLLCGVEGGRILRVNPADGTAATVADTGGRPLGLEVLDDGRVLVCDSHRGLLRIDPGSGDVETLVAEVGGRPLRFCSNAAAMTDGTIWFTESTSRFGFENYRGAILEQRPAGRLFRLDRDGSVATVLDDLDFANGVALTGDQSALIFAETAGYRVSKLWLTGGKAGQRETLLDNMPGFPDNLSRLTGGRNGRGGRIWVAIAAPRYPLLDRLANTPPVIRKAVWRIPDRLSLEPPRATWAIAIDESGAITADYRADRSDFYFSTGAAEHDGRLYLASPECGALLALDLPASGEVPSLP